MIYTLNHSLLRMIVGAFLAAVAMVWVPWLLLILIKATSSEHPFLHFVWGMLAHSWSSILAETGILFVVNLFVYVPMARSFWAWRRYGLRKQGRCMECGYDIRMQLQLKHTHCPECGKQILHCLYLNER